MGQLYVGICSVCNQGRQVIHKTLDDGVLFLACEECESEWASIDDARRGAPAAWGTYGSSRPATPSEMRVHPWHVAIINQADLRAE